MDNLERGDRVVLLRDEPDGNSNLHIGDTGIFLSYDSDVAGAWAQVDWMHYVDGHSCDGQCEGGNGWNVPATYIELLDETELPYPEESDLSDFMEAISFGCKC